MRFPCETLLLAAALALSSSRVLCAADVPREFARLDLTDGRSLKNVVIKTYDPASDRLLVLADGKAMLVSRTLIPAPFAEHSKAMPRSGETVSTIGAPRPLATAAHQYHLATPVPSTGPAIAMPTTPPPTVPSPVPLASRQTRRDYATPNQSQAAQAGINLEAHKRVATERARRYYRFEFRAGSDSIAVTGLEFELSAPKVVPGWEGRVTIEGKAYLETYDSRGRSFQRRTSTFEVTTEKKIDDDEIAALSFNLKS